MELLFYFLIIVSIVLMVLNLIFVVNSLLLPEYLSPFATMLIFFAITGASLAFALLGFNVPYLVTI
jgi:hypothetical protein